MANDTREAAAYLAEEILSNIELSDIALSAVMLKCARLARLLRDEDRRRVFSYEAGGYPSDPDGVPAEVFRLARLAGRVYTTKDKNGLHVERMNTSSVETLEQTIKASQTSLAAAADPNISISSANPTQSVYAPIGNFQERRNLREAINTAIKSLAQSRQLAYNYASNVHFELEFSGAASSAFDRASERIDLHLLKLAPQASQKTSAINENLDSNNPEDWANAVHGCRRLLQEVANELFPPQEPRERQGKVIKLGPDQYINRLIAFIEDNSDSDRFKEIVGSTLAHMGHRLDALFKAAQKGSHAEIASRTEAERYVLYTYMTLGDILALKFE